ncbi:hypothetical protein M378DRAFT_12551 [Amanita muscaria Koide BX008]|uniref:Uncharacterized protein n=1 Tax=Amanita muscaria (strain Koide BX008) TaxID=946122 RepID=A0A0C2SIB9_AMAMK|nr:hypothetical protein M378DRAFT_12551 [Amanita muscaria Koide BX008]
MENEVGELGGSGAGLPEPGQTNGPDYDSGRITGPLEQTTHDPLSIYQRTPVLSRSPAMHQLKATCRGVAQHQRPPRARKVPIIKHIFGRWRSDGRSSKSPEGNLRRALDGLDVLTSRERNRPRTALWK